MIARQRMNLTDKVQTEKDEVVKPSLAYIEKPAVPSKTILHEQRRQQMNNELKKMESNVGNHADSY